jgi:hypothetical protein
MSKNVVSFSEITKEELDKLKLTQEVQQFYSEPDNLKRLLIERALYKKAYETQQEKINDSIKEIDSIMSQKVTPTMTLRDYARNYALRDYARNYALREYYNSLFSKFKFNFDFVPKIKFNHYYKIENDIQFIKNFI